MEDGGREHMFDKFHDSKFYTVEYSQFLAQKEFDLPIDLFLLVINQEGDLTNPKSDPICSYYFAGIQRYIWRDKTWSSYPKPRTVVREILFSVIPRGLLATQSMKTITVYEVRPD